MKDSLLNEDPEAPIVQFENVSYSPGTTPLFQNLNLALPRGQCTVLMGASGAGKSTLLRLGAGLIPPDHGKVAFRGHDWDTITESANAYLRLGLGFSFQNGALWANKSVYQNLELPYLYHYPRAPRAVVREAVDSAAQKTQIRPLLAVRPSQLSLGEQKLVSLTRALVLDPRTLFLDDPTASVDAQAEERLTGLLQELKKDGRTILVVTQDPVLTAKIADYLVLLKGGKILDEGPFSQVVRNTNADVTAILTSVLSQASTFSNDILDLLSIDESKPGSLE